MSRRYAALLLALTATATAAQEPARPTPPPAPPFRFPATQSRVLPNGISVVVVEDHAVQVIAVRAVIAADETLDPPGKEGLYQVMLAALREGTTTRSATQLAEASAAVGTAIAPTSFTTTPGAFEASLALLGDMLMHPSFEPAGIERRKAAQAAVFRANAARTTLVARNSFFALLNGRNDPVARGYLATESAVNALTRDDVAGFYRRYVGPRTTTVVVVGDITPAKAFAAATRVFGSWQGAASAERPSDPPLPAAMSTTVHLADIPGTNAYISMGTTGPLRTDADAFAAEMLGTITTNRMLAALREKRAWSYSGNMVMGWRRPPRRGEFIGTTSIATAKADSALAEWLGVLRAVRAAPPSAEELEAARRARVGALWSRIDGPDETANRIVESVRDGLPPDYLERYAAGMNAVTPADVAAAAQKYLDLEHLVIVVAGDRKSIEPALRASNIAPIVLIDATGKPQP